MIQTVLVRDLHVDASAHPRGQPHLSAASGLVRVGRFLYVVADDEHHIGALDGEAHSAPVTLHRFRADDLPHDKRERKRLKPDLEALCALPSSVAWPHGALLAVGSGSRPSREHAFIFALDASGALAGPSQEVSFAALYRPLRASFPDLNIEGAFVAGAQLQLLQRANKGNAANACIAYPLDAFAHWLAREEHQQLPQPVHVTRFDLGSAGGVPFGFTDGTALTDGGWVFSAVAEDTTDSYADGACAASAIGWVSADGELQVVERISGAPKVEGIALSASGGLLLVSDADDPQRASQLLAARPWPFPRR